MAATVVSFGEWLPDQPALGNPGLTVANNVLPDIGSYKPYIPLLANSAGVGTLPAPSTGLFLAYSETVGDVFYASGDFSAGLASRLYMSQANGSFTAKSATQSGVAIGEYQFAQYENLVFAVNGSYTQYHTLRATTDFVAVPSAPAAAVIGVVNDFIVLGNLADSTTKPHVLQWSAIADPLNFPTPNSATAIATQSGEQFLQKNFGAVTGIVPGDQFALVFQARGITRMTYAGPPVVFQFNEIAKAQGAEQGSIIKARGVIYFYSSSDGFYATDGVSVTPIGDGKVNRFFKSGRNVATFIRAQYNMQKEVITWGFLTSDQSTTSVSNKLFAFHIPTARWTQSDESFRSVDQSDTGTLFGPYAFDENNVLSRWNATTAASSTATITTGDLELNPGGRAYVDGVKPNIEASTTPAVTVRVGARSDLSTTPSYTATTTPTTRTGFADFRVDSKYHRAEVQIVGNFDKAVGIEFKAFPTGEA